MGKNSQEVLSRKIKKKFMPAQTANTPQSWLDVTFNIPDIQIIFHLFEVIQNILFPERMNMEEYEIFHRIISRLAH